MQDGVFQLIFIIVILAASVLDAVARSRKKREQMDEMERQEEAADREPADDEDVIASRDRSRTRRPVPENAGRAPREVSDDAPAPVARQERETSDSMVPDDLWAILTGEQRAPRPQPRPVESSGREDPAAIASRRTEGALGSEVERQPPPPGRPPILSPMPPRRGETETPAPGWRDRLQQRRSPTRRSQLPPPVTVPGEAEIYQGIEEPWSSLPDITEGEIGEDDRVLLDGEGGGRMGQRTRVGSRSAFTRLLESGKPGDLRQAIVLSEILGPPKALRSGDGAPTSLRDPSS